MVCEILVTWHATGWWRVIVVWLICVAQHGTRDVVSQMPLDLSGRIYRALKPTLIAHVDHTRPFFPGHDGSETLEGATLAGVLKVHATVQPWVLNRLIKSKRIGEILHIFHHSRAGACVLLRRLVSANLITISEETITSVECREVLLLPEVLESLRRNRTDKRERHP